MDLRYVLHARYPNRTNEKVAKDLSDVVDGIHNNYARGEIFTGAIFGKDTEGEYGLWEDE